jgi:hypothetical protein
VTAPTTDEEERLVLLDASNTKPWDRLAVVTG